jgi:NDP-sugar pyrophosphorylase family protein
MINELFDIAKTIAEPLLKSVSSPWEAMGKIGVFIRTLGPKLPPDFEEISENVWVGKGSVIAASAHIKGPAIIGRDVEIRHCAFFNQNIVIGDGTLVGNAAELDNCIIFNEVEVPHLCSVTDSILGWKVVLGAGVILAHHPMERTTVGVRLSDGTLVDTGFRKLGSFIGDGAAVGSGVVAGPGTVIGKNTRIDPLSFVGGFIPAGSVIENIPVRPFISGRSRP